MDLNIAVPLTKSLPWAKFDPQRHSMVLDHYQL
jgi:hypothetical protein